MRSLVLTAASPNSLEIAVALDEDDPTYVESVEAARGDQVGCHTTVVTFGTRHGYRQLNEYFNHLAKVSAGRWLMLWNDDARMQSAGWDDTVTGLAARTWVAEPRAPYYPDLLTFPIVRRELVRLVGGFSPHTPHCDTYWQQIGRGLDISHPVDIDIEHLRWDLSGRPEYLDATFLEGQAGWQSGAFYSPEIQDKIAADQRTIAHYFASHVHSNTTSEVTP